MSLLKVLADNVVTINDRLDSIQSTIGKLAEIINEKIEVGDLKKGDTILIERSTHEIKKAVVRDLIEAGIETTFVSAIYSGLLNVQDIKRFFTGDQVRVMRNVLQLYDSLSDMHSKAQSKLNASTSVANECAEHLEKIKEMASFKLSTYVESEVHRHIGDLKASKDDCDRSLAWANKIVNESNAMLKGNKKDIADIKLENGSKLSKFISDELKERVGKLTNLQERAQSYISEARDLVKSKTNDISLMEADLIRKVSSATSESENRIKGALVQQKDDIGKSLISVSNMKKDVDKSLEKLQCIVKEQEKVFAKASNLVNIDNINRKR